VRKPDEIVAKLLGLPCASLDQRTKKVARHVAGRTHIARNVGRISAEHDYEVNLKAELEIMLCGCIP